MAEALQDLITKNAKNNEIEDVDQEARGAQDDEDSDTNAVKPPKKNGECNDDKNKDDNNNNKQHPFRTHGSHPGGATRRMRMRRMMRLKTRWTEMRKKMGTTSGTGMLTMAMR